MKKHKNLMIYGTGSDVGKSIITTGLCRILKQEGFKVCPFKSQNMALNSYITKDGKEMGRAQVVQAEACNLEPNVYMNPILLKPSSDRKSQVILHGKVLKNMSAKEYYAYKEEMKEEVKKAYSYIKENFDVAILEGAGSPAEINLKKNDLVNTGMAEIANSPAILVSDIDKGGMFASIYGTLMLLEEHERKRIKGVIVNKFRGDIKLLEPGLRMIEEKINIPVLGVIPHIQMDIEEEDGYANRHLLKNNSSKIDIAVINTKRISNFTDMDVLNKYSDVGVRYIQTLDKLENPDVIILAGTKNTIEDLLDLKKRGFDSAIIKAARQGTIIFGICGGFQMLGQEVLDPYAIESSVDKVFGLGLLDIQTTMKKEKTTKQYEGIMNCKSGLLKGLENCLIKGYEIHQGVTLGEEDSIFDDKKELNGVIKENIIGTYIHGIFDNNEFTNYFINAIRKKKGMHIKNEAFDYNAFKQNEYDKLALTMKEHLDMGEIYKIIGVES